MEFLADGDMLFPGESFRPEAIFIREGQAEDFTGLALLVIGAVRQHDGEGLVTVGGDAVHKFFLLSMLTR